MTDEQNPLMQIHNALNSIAPHTVIPKAIANLTQQQQQAPAPTAPQGPSEAEKARMQQEQERPWIKSADSFRVVTDQQKDPRLQSFRYQGQNLIGETARAGVYEDNRIEGLAYVGLGDTIDPRNQVESTVEPEKAEVKPAGVPFTNQRKSGEQYWVDEPKKAIETMFF